MSRRGIDCTAMSSKYQEKFANDCFRVARGPAAMTLWGWKADLVRCCDQVDVITIARVIGTGFFPP